jgi:hypothetical protein
VTRTRSVEVLRDLVVTAGAAVRVAARVARRRRLAGAVRAGVRRGAEGAGRHRSPEQTKGVRRVIWALACMHAHCIRHSVRSLLLLEEIGQQAPDRLALAACARRRLAQHVVGDRLLLIGELVDRLVDRRRRDETIDRHLFRLTESMTTILSLCVFRCNNAQYMRARTRTHSLALTCLSTCGLNEMS